MTDQERKQKVAGVLLEELKAGELGWYYISVADEEFRGGYVIQARGPTEAWTLLHRLLWYTPGCETSTSGPIPEEVMARVPEEQRWRKLTGDEALNLGT